MAAGVFYDDYGRRVPAELAGPWSAKSRLQAWCDRLYVLQEDLLMTLIGLGAGAKDAPLLEVEEALAMGREWVETILPVALCLCLGDKHCPHCGGKSYLTQADAIRVTAAHLQGPPDRQYELWKTQVKDTFRSGRRAKLKREEGCRRSAARAFVESRLKSPVVALPPLPAVNSEKRYPIPWRGGKCPSRAPSASTPGTSAAATSEATSPSK